jgi:hypothetical protein
MAAALAAFGTLLEPANVHVVWAVGNIDECLVAARALVAEPDQVPHALLAHVAERHRLAGRVLLIRSHTAKLV